MSDIVRDYSKTVMLPLNHPKLEQQFRDLERRGREEMKAEGLRGIASRSLDIRYVGQGYELNIEAGRNLANRFHAAHQQRYGYSDAGRAVEIVNLRVRMVAATKPLRFQQQARRRGGARGVILRHRTVCFEGRAGSAPVYDRARLSPGDAFRGPAIIVEYSATSVIPPRCRVRVDKWHNLIVEVENGKTNIR